MPTSESVLNTADNFINRRTLLRSAIGAGFGAFLGNSVLPHTAEALNSVVEDITSHPTGNANVNTIIEEDCAKNKNPKVCADNWQPSTELQLQAQTIGPVIEEFSLRALPSVMLDDSNGGYDDEAVQNVLGGTEEFSFDRKELVYGTVSSIVFGLVHNVTEQGVDTKTIPASQTLDGFVYWCLLRRFGIGSSIVAHATFNHKAIQSMGK